jgi:ATP-dependent protease ClpP protease subunit
VTDYPPSWKIRTDSTVPVALAPPAGAKGKRWYRIRNQAGADTAEIYLYDMIGMWGITAAEFTAELDRITAPRIDVRINSQGGEVFDGVAIYNALVRHTARVTTYVDALAASAASFIAMAGDEIVIAETGRMMVHDAHGVAVGNAADMRELADILDSVSNTLAEVYARRAGGTAASWRKTMAKDTWYTADQAVTAKLADRVDRSASSAAAQLDPFAALADTFGQHIAPARPTPQTVTTMADYRALAATFRANLTRKTRP